MLARSKDIIARGEGHAKIFVHASYEAEAAAAAPAAESATLTSGNAFMDNLRVSRACKYCEGCMGTYFLFLSWYTDMYTPVPPGIKVFTQWLSVLCMRSKAWLAARVSLRLARLPRIASSAQRACRLRSSCAAAPGLLAHAGVTKNKTKSMGSKLTYPTIHAYELVPLVCIPVLVMLRFKL